ncbi:MAG: TonB-dependent receptor SusC [Haliscomenobacter sp.]|nr:TonB-dependent receptor SusC [Haliscomenobacter sp.]
MDHIFPFLSQTRKMFSVLMLGLLLISHFPALGLGNFPSASRVYPSLVFSSVEKTITGVVLDGRTREPLIGATISLKGTTQGTTTDLDGRFSFSIPDEASAILIDFIGYVQLEIALEGKTDLEILLQPEALELSQVLVIGYGSTTKREMTGSARSVKTDEFNKGIINSPEQLLQGKVAGVNVTSASGEPGSALNFSIRGPGGVRTGSTPLFVIDGLALDNSGTGGSTNPLAFLNPQDIEAIDVLKDASATAIYGARGANGVVLITTKRGKSGTSSLNYSGNIGFSTLANPIDVFSADEYRKQVPAVGGVLEDLGANTDWQEAISRTAVTHNHNLALSGGSDKLAYYGSFGFQNQEGILKGSQLNIVSGRVNLNQKLWGDRLQIDVNLNAARTYNERPPIGSMIGNALSTNPTYPVYDANGLPYQYQSGANPLRTLELEQDYTTINRVIGNITPSLRLAKGLVYKLNIGVDNSTSSRDYQSLGSNVPKQDGRLVTVNTTNENKLVENYLTYTLQGAKHNLTALAGHSYQRIFVQGRAFSINKFPVSDIEPIYNPGLGQELTLATNKPSGYAVVNELQSFFSRASYQYLGKYLLTATVRADGSSKFGENNKYGIFPSVSLGWVLSEENFLKNGPFTDLKLRAGWGQTGNQEIPSKITQALFTSQVSSSASYPLAESGPFPAGTSYSRLANPDIQWEVSSQTDIGLDFALFKGALSGTVDYFNKVSTDILLEVIPADPVQPAGTFWTNVGDMEITNKGLELELAYRHGSISGLNYSIGGNVTFIDNEVQGSPYTVIPSGSASGSGLTSATINGYVNGQPIGTFFLRDFTGLDDKGLNTFRDANGDGVITDLDRVSLGSALPTRLYNFNGSIGYKGFELAANFNGVSGNKIYDNTANANFYKLRLSKGINTTEEAIEFPNESISNSAPVSSRYLKDGAYLRLNNLTLSYSLNTQQWGIANWVKGLTVSLTGQNLLLITDYDGYDPDVNTDRTINGISSYGIDYLSYPKAKSFIVGLNVQF